MTKVLQLTPLYFHDRSCIGGAERYPVNLARGVVEAAGGTYQAEVISFDAVPRQYAVQPGVTFRLLPAVRQPNPLRVCSWDLPAAVAGADIVHIHQVAMRASEVALLAAKQQGKFVCATDSSSLTSREGVYADRLELADQVLCYSDYGKSLLYTRTPIEVIKGGVDGRFFTPPAAPVRRTHVLYVGRLVPYKSVDQLILALPPELPLVVCGRPLQRDYFRLLKRLARGKRVRFVPRADDAEIRELYRRAWVNVLPTRYEDCYGNLHPAPELMGLTLLEAMACGTPAVCSRVGAMPEFVRHGETGFIFDTPAELTEHLRRLAGDPDLVEAMGRRARRAVEQEFDYRVVGARLLALYEGMLARGGRRREAAA